MTVQKHVHLCGATVLSQRDAFRIDVLLEIIQGASGESKVPIVFGTYVFVSAFKCSRRKMQPQTSPSLVSGFGTPSPSGTERCSDTSLW